MNAILLHEPGRFVTLAMALAASACVAGQPDAEGPSAPLRVTNGGQPFAMWDGARARKAADAACGGRVQVSIYDRFDRATGEWVFPEGCA